MELIQQGSSQLKHEEWIQLNRNHNDMAKRFHLRYVCDADPGITRAKRGNGFTYTFKGKKVTDKQTLERIKRLVLPPAWKNVWICSYSNGHLQATGIDALNRKQYKYHEQWSKARSETKFHRLYEFGKVLPRLRLQLEQDIQDKALSQRRVLATVISLMERTYIRIGNEGYEKRYGSYGLTTLKDGHVKVSGSEIHFSFTGKKGVAQKIKLRNPRLARIVKQCRDIPGKELFQYFNEKGERCTIESGMVNEYIKDATGADFTAKDFRTWAGSLQLLRSLCLMGEASTQSGCRKNIVKALDEVSKKLGNTRTVCKKYYVHPKLVELYEQNYLSRYTKELDAIEDPDLRTDLTTDEKILMKILKSLN